MVMPRTNQSQDRVASRSLGFFLQVQFSWVVSTNVLGALYEHCFFCVQCNGEAESTAWSCYATADLRILPQKEGVEVFSRSEYYFLLVSRMIDLQVHLHWICWTLCFAEIHHLFYLKENDWGFSHFMQLSDVLDPAKGYIKDDTIILEVSYLRVFCSPVLHKT